MKVICLALLTLFAAGCSSNTCKDGYGSFFVFDRGNYHSCKMECHPDEAAHNPEASGNVSAATPYGWGTEEKPAKECRCSATCPCWKRHK